MKAEADAELEPLWQRVYRVQEKSYRESTKHERYCREQRELLRALEDLAASERVMHELDNRKDQIITICKVALANLAIWVRDRFFSSTYAHATWQRLQAFFRLPGRVLWDREGVHVELRPFNNRQLTRDLVGVCRRVNEVRPRLPDGRFSFYMRLPRPLAEPLIMYVILNEAKNLSITKARFFASLRMTCRVFLESAHGKSYLQTSNASCSP